MQSAHHDAPANGYSKSKPLTLTVPTPELNVIYSDDCLIAINKPAGVLVHRSNIDYHESQNAKDLLQEQIGQTVFTVHRLDKPTSGVQLFALNKSMAAATAAQFKNHLVSKDYIAVVRGYTGASGTIENPVRDKDAPDKPKKEATTRYKTLAKIELPVSVDGKYPSTRYSIVQTKPLTGRRHQIRLHMKHIHHPLIGDTSYGKSVHNRFFSDHFSSNRLLLHAERLTLSHPESGDTLTINAERYDDQFQNVLEHKAWTWSNNSDLACQQIHNQLAAE